MKKCLSIILTLILAVSMLAACGGQNETASKETAEQSTAEAGTAEESKAEESTAEESTAEESTAEESSSTGLGVADPIPMSPSVSKIEIPEINVPTTTYEVKEIQTSEIVIPEIKLEDFQMPEFKEIRTGDVSVSVPEIDVEISPLKIESVYSDTYTIPEIEIEVPEYEAPEMKSVFISMADGASKERQEALANLSPEEFAAVAAVQMDLVSELEAAFRSAGINVSIDPMSGKIPIDATLLYDTDKYELTEEGKASLAEIFGVYESVLTQEKFRDKVESIVIEGHTDTAGEYDYNKTLSEKRADTVKEFLLSEESGLSDKAFFEERLTTVGRSFDDPVFQEDGSVNMPASRRVEIRFEVDLDAE